MKSRNGARRRWRNSAPCKAFYLGQDVGRKVDLSVITALEKIGSKYRVLAMLEMSKMGGPAQREQDQARRQPARFRGMEIDMTGKTEPSWWTLPRRCRRAGSRIRVVNVSSKEPFSDRLRSDGMSGENALVTEIMATEMLGVFSSSCIEIPMAKELRDDLRKPEKLVSPAVA